MPRTLSSRSAEPIPKQRCGQSANGATSVDPRRTSASAFLNVSLAAMTQTAIVAIGLSVATSIPSAVGQTNDEASVPIRSRQAQLVIEATRELDPNTPLEMLQAVTNLLNVGASDEARVYFDRLLAKKPTSEALARIYERLGAAAVFRLAREPSLAPEGVTLSQDIIRAANQAARDPKRLAALIATLENSTLDARLGAAHKLAEGRELAAAALLRAMADADRQPHQRRYLSAWKYFDQSSLAPVVAALRCDDGSLQYPALLALGELGREEAVPHLIGLAAATGDSFLRNAALDALEKISGIAGMPTDAAALLEREVMRRLKSTSQPRYFPVDPTDDRRLSVWSWAPVSHEPTIVRYAPRTAELIEANRLAHDLTRLESGQGGLYRVSELALLYALTRTSQEALIDMATQRRAAEGRQLQPLELADSLAGALGHQVHEAALAACTLLGHLGDQRTLHAQAGSSSPLADALRSPDRAVRNAAATAIMQIQPTRPFAGAADLVPIAVSMATTGGSRQALVIHPVKQEAGDLVGLLSGASWNATAVSNGKEAFRSLLESNDFELILLSDAVRQPRFTELLQQLLFDRRTSELPLVVISRRSELSSVEALVAPWAARNPNRPAIRVYPFPYDSDTLSVLLNRTIRVDDLTSSGTRAADAKAAMEWISQVTSDLARFSFYELPQYDERLARALWNPQLAEAAAKSLGRLGTPAAQTALRQAIDSYPPDTAVGRAVRSAFAEAVRRRGDLVTP